MLMSSRFNRLRGQRAYHDRTGKSIMNTAILIAPSELTCGQVVILLPGFVWALEIGSICEAACLASAASHGCLAGI